MKNSTILIALFVCAALGSAHRARAFDSAGADHGTSSHNAPAPAPGWPLTTGHQFVYDFPTSGDPFLRADNYLKTGSGPGAHYVASFVHHSHGGVSGTTADDGAVTNLFLCPTSAAMATPISIDRCHLLTRNKAKEVSNAGWVKVRRAWDSQPVGESAEDGAAAEHYAIAVIAARLAGLDATTLMKRRFWIRYPTADKYVVSPLDPPRLADGAGATEPASSQYSVVGPSYEPVDFGNVGAHVVRGILLPELAQLPDVSSSVADWAAGNEKCLIPGIYDESTGKSVFGGDSRQYDVNGCHDYARVLGPLNAAHFMPAAQGYYRHYHELAKQRMQECVSLAQLNANYAVASAHEQAYQMGPKTVFANNTESHECESEAFVYEMFAQHFLQDAWATGHMWNRWGDPELTRYSPTVGRAEFEFTSQALARVVSVDYFAPAENAPGRRLALAGISGAYAGTIHGAKAVTMVLKRDAASWLSDLTGRFSRRVIDLNNRELFEDPLSAPRYYNLLSRRSSVEDRPVQWIDLAGDAPFSGAGDLYLGPLALADPSAPPASDYAEQRKRLLACSAKSMRDVYDLGPKVHGAAASADAMLSSVSDPNGPECWAHAATNASMLGATGPFFQRRKWDADADPAQPSRGIYMLREQAIALANLLIVENVGEAVMFPHAADGRAFVSLLQDRLDESHINLMHSFIKNARTRKDGMESSRLKEIRTIAGSPAPIGAASMSPLLGSTGIPANHEHNLPATVSYVDGAPATASTGYVRKMFWRSHIKEMCVAGLQPVAGSTAPNLIAHLREKCVASAASGAGASSGDPEVCTACVELTEMHMRHAAGDNNSDPRSKCDILGVEGDLTQLPPEYFTQELAQIDPNVLLANEKFLWNRVAFWAAFGYCTGTKRGHYFPNLDGQGEEVLSQTQVDQCTDAAGTVHPHYLIGRRVGMAREEWLNETSADEDSDPLRIAQHAVPGPVVTALYVSTRQLSGYACGDTVTRYNNSGMTGTELEPGPFYDLDAPIAPDADHRFNVRRRITNDPLLAPTPCGQIARMTWWDKTCGEVSGINPRDLSADISWTNGAYNPITGLQAYGYDELNAPVGARARCFVRGPRRLSTDCPGGSSQCGAGGFCRFVSGRLGSTTLFLDLPPEGAKRTCVPAVVGDAWHNLCVIPNAQERHHMPSADSLKVIPLRYRDGPAIVMSVEDHALTASHGSSAGADKHRSKQTALLANGQFMDALMMDVADIRNNAVLSEGGKYEEAIRQAIRYAQTLPLSELTPVP